MYKNLLCKQIEKAKETDHSKERTLFLIFVSELPISNSTDSSADAS